MATGYPLFFFLAIKDVCENSINLSYNVSYFISSNTAFFNPTIFLKEFAVAGQKPA
jgi:hypothetical protein